MGAEFLAECLKFMAGAALRTIQNLILLYPFDPAGEVWSFTKNMLVIGVVVSVLILGSVHVGKAIGKILNHKGEAVILIISILITGLILEEVDQKKYQKEWERKHSVEQPAKGSSTSATVT